MCQGGGLSQVISSVCWECIYPIKIGAMTIVPSPFYYPDPIGPYGSQSPVCICYMPPPVFVRFGIVMAFWEPLRIAEGVSDAYCFPAMDTEIEVSLLDGLLDGSSADQDTDHIREPKAFFNMHYYFFPLWAAMEVMVDFICVEAAGVDLAYMSEVDYFHHYEASTSWLFPEGNLFGNLVMHMVCVVDSISAGFAGWPIDIFFWCMGTWGDTYPPAGVVNSANMVTDSFAVVAKSLFRMHRELLVWMEYSVQWYCGQYPAPIWRKSWWRFQSVIPVADYSYRPIGYSGLLYSMFKNPPTQGADNFGILIWKLRYCCATVV